MHPLSIFITFANQIKGKFLNFIEMKKLILTSGIALFTLFIVNAQTKTAATTQIPENSNGPVITFDKLVHDYGNVQKGADGNSEFKFTNTGKEPLILSDVKTSWGCTVSAWPKEPILPGKSSSIKVNYTKTNVVGTISKQITVLSNATIPSVVLSIKGSVVDNAVISPEKQTNEIVTPVP